MNLALSVVVPVFNESAVLPAFFDSARIELDALREPYEVIFVDDGSTDDSASLVQTVRLNWPQVRLIRLLRNSGHQAALSAGYESALGDYVVTIDADLQDPPSLVSEMLGIARSQAVDVVYGVRRDRSSDGIFKRWTAHAYYRLMRRLAGGQVPQNVGDFRLVSRRVVDAFVRIPEHSRVYRLIIPWFGFPSAEITFSRGRRAAGSTKYTVTRMISLAIDSVTTFSAAPLRLATWAGVVGGCLCFLAMAYSLTAWLMDKTVPGWTSILGTVGFIGAIQLIVIGLLGEYVARLFLGSLGRPSFVIGYDSHEENPGARPSEPGIVEND